MHRFYKKIFNLESINASKQNVDSLPYLPYVESIFCDSTNISQLPHYPNLSELDISDTYIAILPNFSKLRILQCNDSYLQILPNSPIEYLSCIGTNLQIPADYTPLQYLDISFCYLPESTLPPLPNLHTLICRHTTLKLPQSQDVPKLRVLDSLNTFTLVIPQYPLLKTLTFGKKEQLLQSLPSFPFLEELYTEAIILDPLPDYPLLEKVEIPEKVWELNPNLKKKFPSYEEDLEIEEIENQKSTEFEVSQDEFSVFNCTNDSFLTLSPYTEQDDDVIGIYLPNSENVFKKTSCITIEELLAQIKSNVEVDPPRDFACIYTKPRYMSELKSGISGKPTDQIVFKLPNLQIFITLGSLMYLLEESKIGTKSFYAIPLYSGVRRRIGNLKGLFGSSMNHGQVPGYKVYKIFTQDDLEDDLIVEPDISDYPCKIKDFNLREENGQILF